MGPPTYSLLILFLTMTYTASSQSDTETATESGPMASGKDGYFLFGLDPRSSKAKGIEKCQNGTLCRTDCLNAPTAEEVKEMKKINKDKHKDKAQENIEEHNKKTQTAIDKSKDKLDAICESEICKIWTIEDIKFAVCGSVQMQITGYLFALTVLVTVLPNVFGFFGSYGLAMEKSCGKGKKLPQPEGTPPKPRCCDEWSTGIGTGPAAIAVSFFSTNSNQNGWLFLPDNTANDSAFRLTTLSKYESQYLAI